MRIQSLKALAITPFITFVPSSCSKQASNTAHRAESALNFTFKYLEKDIFEQMSKDSAAKSTAFFDSILDVHKKNQRLFEDNYPNIIKPTLYRDVTQNLYKGSPEFLNTYLSGVLKNKGKTFYNAQQKYGIDAVFLMGITKLESGHGFSDVARKYNNVGGMRTSKGYIRYKSVDDCIYAIAKNLKDNYTDKGLKTIPQIGKKYCESEEWAKKVLAQMKKIHKGSQVRILYFDK